MTASGSREGTGKDDDVSLVTGIANRDERAFEQVFHRHGAAIKSVAMRVLRDPALAEDVLQETLTGFWSAPDRFRADHGSLRSFLTTIAHRRAVDMVRSEVARARREQRHRERQLGAALAVPGDVRLVGLDVGEVRRRGGRQGADYRDRYVDRLGDLATGAVGEGHLLGGGGDVLDAVLHGELAARTDDVAGLDALVVEEVLHLDLERKVTVVGADGAQALLDGSFGATPGQRSSFVAAAANFGGDEVFTVSVAGGSGAVNVALSDTGALSGQGLADYLTGAVRAALSGTGNAIDAAAANNFSFRAESVGAGTVITAENLGGAAITLADGESVTVDFSAMNGALQIA